jgi:hypothetical protein
VERFLRASLYITAEYETNMKYKLLARFALALALVTGSISARAAIVYNLSFGLPAEVTGGTLTGSFSFDSDLASGSRISQFFVESTLTTDRPTTFPFTWDLTARANAVNLDEQLMAMLNGGVSWQIGAPGRAAGGNRFGLMDLGAATGVFSTNIQSCPSTCRADTITGTVIATPRLAVPEPSSLVLVLAGAVAALCTRQRRKAPQQALASNRQ